MSRISREKSVCPSHACRRLLKLLSLVATICMTSDWTVAAENWPQFRGPGANGQTDSSNLPTTWSEETGVKWKTPLHDKGWSSPVIWGDQIWLTSATVDGKAMFALCLDKTTGKILHDIKLFENEDPKKTAGFNSFASPTPVIEEGRVYITFGSYGTACLDTKTAKILWQRRDLACDHWRGPGSSPILFGNLFILHYDGFDLQYVVALNKQNGETVWKTERKVDYGTKDGDVMKAFCTPLIIEVSGKKQLISPTSKAALAYDPLTGEEIWRIRFASFSATGMPLFDGKRVYINTGFGKADLSAVRPDGTGDVTSSHVDWTQTKSIGSKTSQLLVNGLIFNVHDEGIANCLDAETGKEHWAKRLKGKFTSSPLFGDGKVYFFNSDEGTCTVVKASPEYEELALNKLSAGCMASPAVSGNALFVRTNEALYRIEK